MARSMKLGHCVCDPRKPCPCPLFRQKQVCTCAGERDAPASTGTVRLTDYVRSAGCAGKIAQKDLHQVLGMLPPIEDSRLLVGTASADDAGVFQLTPDVTLVQTVDVFTPGVDDPYLFGRIAGCNSLSDVYAMGGRPVTALSVIGFPIHSLPHEVMADILRGGMDVLKEAGTVLVGGHSIDDEEVKFGFAVTGVVEPGAMVTNSGARAGDVLVLTKPLGTGILSFAGRLGRAPAEGLEAAIVSMSALNKTAAEIMLRFGATACTDVTGFGLLGHLCELAMGSAVTAELWCDRLPLLPGALQCAEAEMVSGANERNAEFCGERTQFDDDIPEPMKAIMFDAQTSGGLLIAVPPQRSAGMLDELHAAGIECAAAIGRIVAGSTVSIIVRRRSEAGTLPDGKGSAIVTRSTDAADEETAVSENSEPYESGCCAGSAASSTDPMGMFQQFLGTSLRPGQVDVVTKELVAIALALGVQCEECAEIHVGKALRMGISPEELEEVAAIAIGFGGCKTMMLWNRVKEGVLKQGAR